MRKAELIASVAEKSGLTRAQASDAVDAFVESVGEGLMSGDKKITLVGFGTWSVEERGARTGRNPRTGEQIDIPAKNVVKFKVGATLAGKVN